MATLTGAIVSHYDNTATALKTLVGTDQCFAGDLPTDDVMPYISISETGSSVLSLCKGSPGHRIDSVTILFDCYASTRSSVGAIIREIEYAYLPTILTIENRTQIGNPIKLDKSIFKDGDRWHGQLSLGYPIQKS